jgi:hypothetical protein
MPYKITLPIPMSTNAKHKQTTWDVASKNADASSKVYVEYEDERARRHGP